MASTHAPVRAIVDLPDLVQLHSACLWLISDGGLSHDYEGLVPKGDYFENCNCVGLCTCQFGGAPAEGHCDVGFAFHIEESTFNRIALDGLNFFAVFHTPGTMNVGSWTGAEYVDDHANPRQQEALSEILSGAHGGPFERFMRLTADFTGIK